MAWNRSVEPAKVPVKRGHGVSLIRLFLYAFCVVAVMAVGVLYFQSEEDCSQSINTSETRLTSDEKMRRKDPSRMSEKIQDAVADERIVASPNPDVLPVTNSVVQKRVVKRSEDIVPKARYDVFRHRSECQLAALVCAPYGAMFIGSPRFDDRFIADLKQSLKEPIEISDDDPADIRHYKESVIEVKKEIQGMFDRGEDVAEQLTKTWNELQKLGAYKAELETQMRRIRHDNAEMSNEEISDLVGAVNTMLKENGIEPMEYNKLTGVVVSRKPFPEPEDVESEEKELSVGHCVEDGDE